MLPVVCLFLGRSNVTNKLSKVFTNPWKIITSWRFWTPVISDGFELPLFLTVLNSCCSQWFWNPSYSWRFCTPVIPDGFEIPVISDGFETQVIPSGFKTPHPYYLWRFSKHGAYIKKSRWQIIKMLGQINGSRIFKKI